MTISSKKTFKALIIDKEGLARKVHLKVIEDSICEDRGKFFRLWFTILMMITIIGIIILEIMTNDSKPYAKLFAMNEVRGIRRVKFKMNPNNEKEFSAIAFAIGYDQMVYISTKEDSDLIRYINEQYFEELTYEDYQKVAQKYENRIQMFRDTNKYAPLVIVLILLIIAVAVATPIIVSSIL